MKFSLYSYCLRYKKPFLFKHGIEKYRKGLLVQKEDNWGEIAPLKGFSKETYEQAKEQIQALFEGRFPDQLYPSVDFALSSLFNPLEIKNNLKIASLGAESKGNCVKVKVHHLDIDDCIQFVKTLLKNPFKKKYRIDCNQSWSLEEGLYFAKQFQPKDFDYIEEPIKTLEGTKEFIKQTGFPVALDESLINPVQSLQDLQVKSLIIKPTLFGGLRSLKKFTALANRLKAEVIISSSFESGIGIMNGLGLASQLNPNSYHGLDTLKYFTYDLLEKPLAVQKKQDKLLIKPNAYQIKPIRTWNISSAHLKELQRHILTK